MNPVNRFFAFLPTLLFISSLAFAQDTTLTVTETGNVGIGTTTPAARLHVVGNAIVNAGSSANAGLEVRGLNGTWGPSAGVSNGSQEWRIASWSDNSLVFTKVTGTTFTPLRIFNNSFSNALVLGPGGVGVGNPSPSAMLDVAGDIAVSGNVDGVDVSAFKTDYDNRTSKYFQFGSLNHSSVDVTSSLTKLGTTAGTHAFTKGYNDTKIEVRVNSRFSVGTITSANGVRFHVRIDDTIVPDLDNQASLVASNASEFQSILAVFENLTAGAHTVSIWAQAVPSGSATSVVVDPGGWGGRIIVKETR